MTIRSPSRSLSSRISLMPSIFFSLTREAMCSMSFDLFTWYGISVTTICSRSFPVRSIAAFGIGVQNSLPAQNEAARRKIRAGHKFQEFGQRGVRMLDQMDGRVDGLFQIMRRNVGGHADGDAGGAVDQQIGIASGKNLRLLLGFIVVGPEIDGLFVDVFEQRRRDAGQAGFGVTFGRRRVAIDRSEVALAIH